MAVRQASAGISRWYSADGTSWGTSRNTDTGLNLWRIGTPDDLRALAGLAIRGWEIRGRVNGPIRRAIELAALQGCAYPQPKQLITPADRDIDMVRAATSIPIGAIPTFGDIDVVGSPEWVGLFTSNFVTRRERDDIPYPTMGQFTLLVSPKPRWRVSAPQRISVGEEVVVQVAVDYADGEKVVGLQLEVSAGAGTEVRGTSGGWGSTGRAYTNASGVATFRVRGVQPVVSRFHLYPVPLVNLRASLFEPTLPGSFDMVIDPIPTAPQPDTCVTYPAIPGVPAVPSSIRVTPVREWNAGANSVDELDGDVSLRFETAHAIGVVLGLTQNRDIEAVGSIERITHGIYFHATASGQFVYRVMESGKLVTPAAQHVASDEFEVRRVGTAVLYFRNGEQFYQSRTSSSGTVSAASALYASGDTAP